jgi:hypothetical protein
VSHNSTEGARPMRLVLIAMVLGATPSYAEMPVYDVEKHCEKVGWYGGNLSPTARRGCVIMEQQAYDALKPRWDTLPAALRDHCDEVARYSGGSYTSLQGCLRVKSDAERYNRSLQVKP